MTLLEGIKRLDYYERWVTQLLAARGLQLEIQKYTSPPHTDGWFRGQLDVKNL